MKARNLMSERLESRTQRLLTKANQLMYSRSSPELRSLIKEVKKEMDEFEEYTERVAGFINKL